MAENKQTARIFVNEVLNKGNLENVHRTVTPDFVYHSAEQDLLGMEDFKKCVASDQVTFHNIKYTVIDCIAEDDKVAAIWMVEATHQKDYRGIPATHKKFETVGVNILHFQGNKIKEAWAVADGLSAALQLGVVRTEFGQAKKKNVRTEKSDSLTSQANISH